MKMSIGIYVIVLFTIVSNVVALSISSPDPNHCIGNNEVYSECLAHCEPTCENRDSSECAKICKPGCICMDGFFRRDGECVSSDQCEITCEGENEVFRACANHDFKGICEKDPAQQSDPPNCLDFNKCLPGCNCQDGFLRNSQDQCVPSKTCFECGVNETFTECDSGYQSSCSRFGSRPSAILGNRGCYPGCNCKEGYVKDYEKNQCILESDCTYAETPCKPELDSLVNCDCASCDECSTLEEKITCKNLNCVLGCKDCNGCGSTECGNSLESCGITLDENEIYNNCSTLCSPELTCFSLLSGYQSGCSIPPSDLAIKCVPRRECKTGYVRNINTGKCDKLETCCDDPNAEVVTCPNPCSGGTCEAPEFSKCKWSCAVRGCQCKKGYVKNLEGKCILLEQCPKPQS